MKDNELLNNLWDEVAAGRVNASQMGSRVIFKYTQNTHLEDAWNDVNRQARGIIFHVDGTVIARPFPKFFNMNERPETAADKLPWSEGVEIYEKLDGSCGTGYYDKKTYQWQLATPGSMESDQAIEGTRILNESIEDAEETVVYSSESKVVKKHLHRPRYRLPLLPQDCTPVFEIIYPENRIVVDYKGETKLVLLTVFEHDGTEWHPHRVDMLAEMCHFTRPRRYDFDLHKEIPFEENAEGYVIRFSSGLRVKVKSPEYVRIHRLLNHLSAKGIVQLIRENQYGDVINQLPKEIVKDFDDARAHVQGLHNTLVTDSYSHLTRMTSYVGENTPRKDKALWIMKNVPSELMGFVFSLLDHKDIEDKVWKLVLTKVKEEIKE